MITLTYTQWMCKEIEYLTLSAILITTPPKYTDANTFLINVSMYKTKSPDVSLGA